MLGLASVPVGVLADSGNVGIITLRANDEDGFGGPFLRRGQAADIRAMGTWCMGGTFPTGECDGPDGIRPHNIDEADPLLPTAQIGALIARIGDGPWFEVGSSSTFQSTRAGYLHLQFNEIPGTYGDNSRSIRVAVTRSDQ